MPRISGWATSLAMVLLASACAVHAATLSTLHSFTAGDGAFPAGPLILDRAGNLYGTTGLGGAANAGTVFELSPGGSFVFNISFVNTNGAYPAAGLMRNNKGDLFGTTFAGGVPQDCGSGNGCGTVFELVATQTQTPTVNTLHSFDAADGTFTYATPIKDGKGSLAGTTFEGGAGYGTAFKLSLKGAESPLYSFMGGADGAYPSAGLIEDAQGNLYGTTYGGGTAGRGTVFEISAAGTEFVLHAFAGGSDGVKPFGGLIRDKHGNFYGTTEQGGTSNLGTVFEVTATGTETVLHSFAGGNDGASPRAGLVRKGSKFYGTTYAGGAAGDGTVFEISSQGVETVLYSFSGNDGSHPYAGLVLGSRGNLYGTTYDGGASVYGTVFKLAP
jgi:uncharacterized repeat protein (TIGR03803 family)